MMTTANLPADMRFDPDDPIAKAVRGSGLRVECRHGDPTCPRCITAAARALVATERAS
jgi:hypothetical protein